MITIAFSLKVNAWMVGIKKVVHELRNLPNSLPQLNEDTEVTGPNESPVNSLETATDTVVHNAPGNQNTDDSSPADTQTDTSTDTAKS